MASLNFLLRTSSRNRSNPGSLCLRIIHQRKIKVVTSSYRLFAEEWDAGKQEPVSGNNTRKAYLDEVKKYLERSRTIFNFILDNIGQKRYTVKDITMRLVCSLSGENSLSAYTDVLCQRLAESGQVRTSRAYQSSTEKLISFTKHKDIQLSKIDKKLLYNFEHYLKAKGRSLNTISFYMRNLRAIYNKAMEESLIQEEKNSPFKGVFTGVHKTQKRALGIVQIQNILNLKYKYYLNKKISMPSDENLKMYTAWRLFVFCFHARGMCFVDAAFLRKDNIYGNIIRYYRKKTGGLIEVKITPVMKALIDSFGKETQKSPYLFPIIVSSQKSERLQYESALRRQNRLLKELGRMAGITSKLSTHVSRHSWASIAKQENLPLWVISEGLGHSNEKTTYTYLASLERSYLDRANDVICAAVDIKLNN